MVISKEQVIQDLQEFYDKYGTYSSSVYKRKWDSYSISGMRYKFGSWGNFVDAADIPHDMKRCPECGNLYERLGDHWGNDCDFPSISAEQHEILTGFLLGDGNVHQSSGGFCYFQAAMINKKFLKWIDGKMEHFGNSISLAKTAKESAKENRERGFHSGAKERNYSDKYRWSTTIHPEFDQYWDWYSTGQKRFPDDLELAPLTLKVWYCGDGNRATRKYGRDHMRICNLSQWDQKDVIRESFRNIGVKTPFRDHSHYIQFGVDDSEFMWDYMGEPLPGFEYKWP